MELKDYFKKIIHDPTTPQSTKDDLQAMWDSHLTKGRKFQTQGLLREAIQEYEKEMDRPIKTYIDAEIVESAFWQTGNAYSQLGEIDQALAAYNKALELFREYGVGVGPHLSLAKLYLEQQRIEEAIIMCQEYLEQSPENWGAKQILAQAMALKSSGSTSSDSS